MHSVRDVIASPTLILAQYRTGADLYVPHVLATVRSAAFGFVIGTSFAVGAAILFCRFPAVEGAFRGVNIALFAMPPIVVGPVLAIVFNGDLPQIILAALVVYFPAMAATLVGLRDIDPRLLDVIRTYGGGPNAVMRFVRLRSALPAILAGLRTAAPLSVLGAILGEFGSGVRWGLGSFLLGSLGTPIRRGCWGSDSPPPQSPCWDTASLPGSAAAYRGHRGRDHCPGPLCRIRSYPGQSTLGRVGQPFSSWPSSCRSCCGG